jgi:hypothetical protein
MFATVRLYSSSKSRNWDVTIISILHENMYAIIATRTTTKSEKRNVTVDEWNKYTTRADIHKLKYPDNVKKWICTYFDTRNPIIGYHFTTDDFRNSTFISYHVQQSKIRQLYINGISMVIANGICSTQSPLSTNNNLIKIILEYWITELPIYRQAGVEEPMSNDICVADTLNYDNGINVMHYAPRILMDYQSLYPRTIIN